MTDAGISFYFVGIFLIRGLVAYTWYTFRRGAFTGGAFLRCHLETISPIPTAAHE